MDGQLGIGLIGAGAFGTFSLDAFAAMPEVKVVAVADIDVAKARLMATKHGARAYPSLERMLEDPYVNIVVLDTPPHLHAEQALAAINAGKHIFSEKPMALTISDTERVLTAAEDMRVRAAVAYITRFNPFYLTVASLRQDQILGQLRHIDLTNHAAGRDIPPTHWFWDRSRSGGIWIEHGIHFFDAFAWITGTPGEIVASNSFARVDGMIDRVEAIARYGEAGAHFYHGFDQVTATERTTVRFTFEGGYVTLREWMPTIIEITTWMDSAPLMLYLPGSITPEKRDGKSRRLRAYAPQGKTTVFREALQDAMRDLIYGIRDPGRPLSVSGADMIESLRMALSAS